jgi:hypothetical protein
VDNINERYDSLSGESVRYCGRVGAASFRKIARTFSESLGNKWIVSLDECDSCNAPFSLYEDALAKAVSPFLNSGRPMAAGMSISHGWMNGDSGLPGASVS